MDCSTSGLPVHHQLPEFIQTHSRMSHSKVGRLKVVWEGQDIWETTFLCGLEWASLTRLYFLPGSYWRWDVCPILGVHSTSNCPLSYYSSEAKVAQLCPTLCDTMGCSPPGSLSMEFSRQEYLSGLPFPSPGDLPNSGDPNLEMDSLPFASSGKLMCCAVLCLVAQSCTTFVEQDWVTSTDIEGQI